MRHLLAAAFIASLVASPVSAQGVELVVADAQPFFDETTQEGGVLVRLDRESGRAFAQFTHDNLQKRINVLVDGEVNARPMIMTPILGALPITGLTSAEAASALSARLKSGKSVITVAPAD